MKSKLKVAVVVAATCALAAPASADTVNITVSDSLGHTASFSPNGTFFIGPFVIGSFAINFIQGSNFRPGLSSPFLSTSEIDVTVQNSSTTLQTLTVDVSLTGTAPPSGLQRMSSEFEAAGIVSSKLHDETFVNGVSQGFADFPGTVPMCLSMSVVIPSSGRVSPTSFSEQEKRQSCPSLSMSTC